LEVIVGIDLYTFVGEAVVVVVVGVAVVVVVVGAAVVVVVVVVVVVLVHVFVAVDREPSDHPVKGGVLDEPSEEAITILYSEPAGYS
jgi:hypothetical protein